MSDQITGIPHALDARLQHLCGELRDLGNSLAAIGDQLQTAPEHVHLPVMEQVLHEAGAAPEKIREYRRLLQQIWETR